MNLMISLNLIYGSMFLIIYRNIPFIKNYTISIITEELLLYKLSIIATSIVFYFHDA